MQKMHLVDKPGVCQTMIKTIVVNPGTGDLHTGFERVTVTLWTSGYPLPEQFLGSLDPAPDLAELYRNWQLIYQRLCDRLGGGVERLALRSPITVEDEIEIDEDGITNVSVVSFTELCHQLQKSLNNWLQSEPFLNVSRQVRSQITPDEEIRVIVETNDELLRRLPWHGCDFYRDYPMAETAVSQLEYKRTRSSRPAKTSNKVRILAIFGNSQGIDLEFENNLLANLDEAETTFLMNPTRAEFTSELWHPEGWDILFFAGHSHSQGETGRIYINENPTNNSLTIEQLEEALKAAIGKGLKLAIFNSCDGLRLASALGKLHIPTAIVMRLPVPNRVAQEFFRHFMQAFATERLPLYIGVQHARRKLQGVEDEFPGASWLPVICQNPAVEPPSWQKMLDATN